MTRFTVTFLVAFKKSQNFDEKIQKDQVKNLNVKKKNRKEPIVEQRGGNAAKEEALANDPRCLKSDNFSQCCHIEYTFIPNKFSYSADIIFCGNMAHLYTDNDVQYERVVNYTDDVFWCLFSLIHEVNLSTEDIILLHNSYVTIKLYPADRNMLSPRAKLCVEGFYYLKPEHVNESFLFAPLYIDDPLVVEPDPIQNYIEFLIETLIMKIDPKYEVHKISRTEESYHKSRACIFLNRINSSFDPSPNRAVVPKYFSERLSTKVETDSKSVKLAKTKSFTKPCVDCSFPGEMIFTDHKEILLETKSELMSTSYILITVENFLTFEQRFFLNPLTISINEIINLPTEQLKQDGYEQVYIKYNIPNFGKISTHSYPLKTRIKINEGRAFLTHQCDKLTLINFIQSGRIYMEIRGIRSISTEKSSPCLFGNRFFDNDLNRNFNKRIKNIYQYTMESSSNGDNLLCLAPVRFMESITTAWSYSHSQPCVSDNSIWRQSLNKNGARNHKRTTINLNDIHFYDTKQQVMSIINSQTLLELNTRVNVTLTLFAPLQLSLLSLLGTDLPFARIVMVIYDEESAINILTLIHSYNMRLKVYNKPKEPWLDCVISKINYGADNDFRINYEETGKSNRNLVTGFVIDDGNKFILFLEGIATGFLQTIWNKIMFWDEKIAHISYESDLVFKNRLYYHFLPCIAIFTIILKVSLETLLSLTEVHLKGNMPIPCWQAIRKLNFLLLKPPICLCAQRHCLPLANELASLNIEFGIPFNQSRFKMYPFTYNTLRMGDAQFEEMIKNQY